MTRPGDGIHTELLEAAYQELSYLLTHLIASLPVPVLIAVGARRSPLRQKTGLHRAGAQRR